MTRTKVIQKPEPKTVVEKVQDVVDDHVKIVIAIVQDYVGGDGMEHEISIAHDNLRSEIDLLDGEEDELSFETLMEKIKDHDDFDADKLLSELDPDDVESWAGENDYILIQVSNMNLKSKLEDFIKSEIYPHLSDQNTFTNI